MHFRNAKQQTERMTAHVQPVSGDFSNYAKFRVSSQLDLHGVTTIRFIFSTENLHALDFNTLEQRIPRHVVSHVM